MGKMGILAVAWAVGTMTVASGVAVVSAAEPPRARLAPNGAVLVDGKPFLPIFVWAQPSKLMGLYKELNFNVLHAGETEDKDPIKPYLDKAHAQGMMLLVECSRYQEQIKGHPAILAWTVEHEADMARKVGYNPQLPANATNIWIEGEKPKASTFQPNPWLNKDFDQLSEKRWLTAAAPAEGQVVYEFDVPKGGSYALWVREFTKNWSNPTRWQIDDEPAQETPRTLKAEEVVDLGSYRGVAWSNYGQVTLKPGKHTLTMRVVPGRTEGDASKPPGKDVSWALDAICLTTAGKHPGTAAAGWGVTRPPSVQKANYEQVKQRDPNALTWNILTSQFYEKYARLPLSTYDEYLRNTDILSFDHYPVTGWNAPDRLAEVGLATTQLVGMAHPGQPVWTIVEASDQQLTWTAPETRGPTAQEMRAEVWMSIAAGAKGIGYFTIAFGRGKQFNWSLLTDEIRAELKRTNGELAELAAPIVMGDTPRKLTVSGDGTTDKSAKGHAIMAIRKEYEGKTYVIAVNMTREPVKPTFKLDEAAAGTSAQVWKENRTVKLSADGSFTDAFEPLAVHVYVIGG